MTREVPAEVRRNVPATVAEKAAEKPDPDPKTPQGPKVVQGSSDKTVRDSTYIMANRTGHTPVPLTRGSLVNTEEVTLVTHGSETLVEIGGKPYTPKKLAEALRDSGWEGGTIRLAACKTGVACPGGTPFGQQLAAELKKLGLESAVIAPKGNVNVMAGIHGLPQVRAKGAQDYQAPGKGWEIYME